MQHTEAKRPLLRRAAFFVSRARKHQLKKGSAFIVSGMGTPSRVRTVGGELKLVEQRVAGWTLALAEIIKCEILHLVIMAAVMAALRLAVVGRDDHLIAGF